MRCARGALGVYKMKNYRFYIILLSLVLGIAACDRSMQSNDLPTPFIPTIDLATFTPQGNPPVQLSIIPTLIPTFPPTSEATVTPEAAGTPIFGDGGTFATSTRIVPGTETPISGPNDGADFTATPVPQPESQGVPAPTAEPLLETELSRKMVLNKSSTVRISLVFVVPPEYTPIATIIGNDIFTSPVDRDFGTPGAPLSDQLGDDNIAYVTARLEGSGFNIKPLSPEQYYFEEGRTITWSWSVTPQQGGEQDLLAVVDVRYERLSDGRVFPYQIGSPKMTVDVEVPIFTQGPPVAVTGLLGILLGAVITPFAPALFGLLGRRFRKEKEDPVREMQIKALDQALKNKNFEGAWRIISRVEDDALRNALYERVDTELARVAIRNRGRP